MFGAGAGSIGAMTSSFAGLAVQSRTAAATSSRTQVTVQASKVCDLTGKKKNKANNVTFSGKRNRKWQNVNLQEKKIYWPEGQRMVRMKVSTKALKTIEKKGLSAMAKEAGIDLWKLPFTDCSEARRSYLEREGTKVPMGKNARAMKNQEKIDASKKKPVLARYELGRIVYYREGDATLN